MIYRCWYCPWSPSQGSVCQIPPWWSYSPFPFYPLGGSQKQATLHSPHSGGMWRELSVTSQWKHLYKLFGILQQRFAPSLLIYLYQYGHRDIYFMLWVIIPFVVYCCSVAQSCLTLQPHGLHHSRLPCPLLSPRVCSKSCLLSQWCHLTISSSATFFSFCLQFFPA